MEQNGLEIPWIINLELTNACNLECIFCDHKHLKKKMLITEMDEFLLVKVLSDIEKDFPQEKAYELGLVGLGEPTLDLKLKRHIEIINNHHNLFERITLNSNLVSLTKDKAELLLGSKINAFTFSVNASNRIAYKRLMGRDKFNRVLTNLNHFLFIYKSKHSSAKVDVQIIDSQENSLNELMDKVSGPNDFTVNFFIRKIYRKPVIQDGNPLLHIYKPCKRERYPCWDIYSRVYIDVFGNLYPCTIGNDCYRESSELCLGNVQKNSIIELFNNGTIREARCRSEKGEPAFLLCESCNIWSLTPNNFQWNTENRVWRKKEKPVRAYGLKG